MRATFFLRSLARLRWVVVAFLVALSVDAGAAPVDAGLVGNWLLESVESGGQKEELRDVVWKIGNGGEMTLHTARKELGTLTSNPETWAVRRPDHSGDVAHGTYRLLGFGSFSTRVAGLPVDDIIWKRIAAEGKPSRVHGALLKLIAPAAAGGASRPAFNAALVGLWETTYTLNDSRHEVVWRITPDGQSLWLDVEMKTVPFTATGGRLKMVVPGGKGGPEFPYRLISKDVLEFVVESDPAKPKLRCSRTAEP